MGKHKKTEHCNTYREKLCVLCTHKDECKKDLMSIYTIDNKVSILCHNYNYINADIDLDEIDANDIIY